MYNVMSPKAEEFISDEEIRACLAYAEKNKNNRAVIEQILEKAAKMKGISHKEALVLLDCELDDENEKIYTLARKIKEEFYGNRIVMFAPLYLSNYCINGCEYCPYHAKNHHIPRKKLTQDEIRQEVIALQDMGHKRLALEAGEDPIHNPLEYILESIQTIYSIKHKNGAIRRVNVNIAATTVENYRKLKEAGIGTYILFQETYNKKSYEQLHPSGPKSDYAYHTEAMDRAMDGGIDDVGCCSVSTTTAMISPASSCTQSISKPTRASARTPSAFRACAAPMTLIRMSLTTAFPTTPLQKSSPVSASLFRTPA